MARVWERTIAFLLIFLGLAVAYISTGYRVGSFSQMGPGYFPIMIGLLLSLIGIANLASIWNTHDDQPDVPWLGFCLIFLSVLAWALLVERAGLVPASFALIAIATCARRPVNLVQLLATCVIVSVLSAVIFIGGFGLPLKTFAW